LKLFFYSLRSRIFLSTTFIVVVLSLVFGWLSISQQTASLEQALVERGQITARHLAYGAELGVLTHDAIGLKALLKKLQQEKDVVYAEVFDEKGNLIAAVSFASSTASNTAADPDYDSKHSQAPLAQESWQKALTGKQETYEFFTPVISDLHATDESMLLDEKSASLQQTIGSIHVALGTTRIRAAIHQTIINGIGTFAVLMLFALLIAWWLSRALTGPLENMIAVIRKTESGNLDQRLNLSGNNEITQLSLAFNRMLDALNERDRDLHAQQRIMQLILDTAPVGIWVLDVNRRIKFMNRAFADAVGISEQEFLAAKHYAELMPEQVVKQCMASDEQCFDTNGLTSSQESIPCVDGKVHIFDVVKAPLQGEQGKIIGLVGIAIDATARIEADAEKEQMQKQVEHTQRLESLGVLAGGIAHDFNNLLTSIMGNAALAERKVVHDPVAGKEFLSKIVQSSEKAALLCKQMLAYSGKGHFIIKPIHLSTMVKSVTSLLGASIHRTIELNYHLADQLPCIEADEAQLQQVVMNLVINASDAIGEQGGAITLSTGRLHADVKYLAKSAVHHENMLNEGEYVYLEVSDTGCGMDKDTRQRLFEPFFTTKFTGRGLGMSAVQGIVRGHKGAVNVYSEPGRGTTFKILFPASDMIAEESESTEADLGDWQTDGTVLIVDDEEMIRETAAIMLEDMGFDTITAVDGLDGVAAYQRHQHDIVAVLLDMTMPRLDGEGCFRKLRQINPNVQVILSSGYNEQDATAHFSGKGLAGFVQKPYHPDVLRDAMRQLMNDMTG
jgi:PAS domain S-box-containing protein